MALSKIIVSNKTQAKQWLAFGIDLYKNDANYIQPLNKDIQAVFNTSTNSCFKNGLLQRWLIVNEKNIIQARIAVFINNNYKQSIPTGGFGFFECIQNYSVANFTLSQASLWLQEQGMQAMDGPINFGERDKWWGCLVDGFSNPLYGLNYGKPYYASFFEQFGMQVLYEQYCFLINKNNYLPTKANQLAATILQKNNIEIKNLELSNLNKFATDFCTIYNQAFAQHAEGKQVQIADVLSQFNSMKAIIDANINWFVYANNNPVAVFLNLPDLNYYFKAFKGKLTLLQKIQLLLKIKLSPTNKFVGIVYGIVPQWQGKGIDAVLFNHIYNHLLNSNKYNSFEMQWIGSFNTKMVNLANKLGCQKHRTLLTFRYMINKQIPFAPLPKI
jgi:hypothetical protein